MQDFTISSRGSTFLMSGELDMASAPLLQTAIAPAVTRGGPITLDVSGVTFMDSAGLHAIVKASADVPGGCVILHGVREHVHRVIEVSGVDAAKNLHVTPCTVPV